MKILLYLASTLFILYGNDLNISVQEDYEPYELYQKFSSKDGPIKESEIDPERFFQLGWSKDSKFAFMVIRSIEAEDCERAELFIQNLKNDEIIFNKKFTVCTDEFSSRKKSINFALKIIQNKHSKEISDILSSHGIINKKTKLQEFPIKISNDTYIDYIRSQCSESNLFYSNEMFISQLKLFLVSHNNNREKGIIKKKKIFDKKFNLDLVYDAELLGYLPSPFNNEIALVMVYIERGWEKTPYPTRYIIVGASLSKNL